jgi:hypothetical protein
MQSSILYFPSNKLYVPSGQGICAELPMGHIYPLGHTVGLAEPAGQ